MNKVSTISFSKPVDAKREAVNARKKRYREKRKTVNHEAKARKIKTALAKDLGKSPTSQQMVAIESDERRKAFMHYYYEYDGNIAAACAMVGVSRRTFNRWLSEHPEMATMVEEVSEAMLDLAEQQLMRNIAGGKENSLFFFLCNKGRHRGWQDVRKLTGPQIRGMKVTINYPKQDPTDPVAIPVINVTDAKGKDVDEKERNPGS